MYLKNNLIYVIIFSLNRNEIKKIKNNHILKLMLQYFSKVA